jgi:SAM-dependent methyltransferase
MKKNDKVMLNVASGVFVMKDYVNLDNSPFLLLSPFYSIFKFLLTKKYSDQIRKFVEARQKAHLIRFNCNKPLPFNDSSVDHIYCSHFIEHLYREDAVKVINDFYNKLKKGGTIHIIVPDLALLAENYLKREEGDSSADRFVELTVLTWPKRPNFLFRFFSVIGSYGLTHLWMYDRQSLTQIVTKAGFTIISKERVPNPTIERDGLHITAIK